MTDQEHADRIEAARRQLVEAIQQANKVGLNVDVETTPVGYMGGRDGPSYTSVVIHISVFRPLTPRSD